MHRTKDVLLRYFCTYRADKIPSYTEQNPVLQLRAVEPTTENRTARSCKTGLYY